MAYATVSHVQALAAPLVFTASSQPTTDQVAGFLTQTAAVLDGILTAKAYSLPIATTATAALEALELYNAQGAGALALRSNPNSPKDRRDAADKAWELAQKMLKDGTVELPGLARDTGQSRVRIGSNPTAMFTRNMAL